MKNILIPTDFTTASVRLAAQAVRTLNEKVNIVFFHAFQQPFYYNDLVRNEDSPNLLITDTLRQQCKQFKEKYSNNVGTITFSFMRGDTNALFRNYVEANNIDVIVCPQDYTYKKVHKESINPVPFFKKSKVTLLQQFIKPQRIYVSDNVFADMYLAS